MSDVLYPLAAIRRLEFERINRVLVDDFEDGTTQARRFWGARNFKRRLRLSHAALRDYEAAALLDFHAARSGGYDPFYFRDNIYRTGSVQVRFPRGFQLVRERMLNDFEIILEEVSPTYALPSLAEVIAAAGSAPLAWYDPARQRHYTHPASALASTLYADTDVMDRAGNYPALWQHGSTLHPHLYAETGDAWRFTGTQWAKTASNPTQISGSKPALTLMAFVKQQQAPASITENGVPLFVGTAPGGQGLGLFMTNETNWRITDGATNHASAGGAISAQFFGWESLAIITASASDVARLYQDTVLRITTTTLTRNHAAGPISLGAKSNGTDPFNCNNEYLLEAVGQALVWAVDLTTVQLKAVHNLFAPAYGLPPVA